MDSVLEKNRIPAIRIKGEKREYVRVDITNIQLPQVAKGKTCDSLKAANTIGIPVSVLRKLKATGEFEVTHLPRGRPGYHELDIAAFVRKLKGVAAEKPDLTRAQPLIRFSQIVKCSSYTVEMKVATVRRMLRGEIPVVGRKGNRIGGLLIPKELLMQYRRDDIAILADQAITGRKDSDPGNQMTVKEAAKELHCNDKVVRKLIALDLLVESRFLQRQWISRGSLQKFTTSYSSLQAIAETMSTSSRQLMRICVAERIQMVMCDCERGRRKQAFVRVADQKRLLKHRSIEKGSRLRRAR